MLKPLIIMIAMFFIATTSQQTNAQSKHAIETLIACLHDVSLSADGDDFTDCTSNISDECFDLDPPGGFGQGGFTAENCFLQAVEQIKLKMNNYLENGWPDANNTQAAAQRTKLPFAPDVECSTQTRTLAFTIRVPAPDVPTFLDGSCAIVY